MSARNIHVVPIENGWAVESEGSAEGRQLHVSQEAALAAGTEKAKQEKVELIIHGRDGKIRERNSFGNDPLNIPG